MHRRTTASRVAASSSLVRRIRSSGSGAFGSGAVARVGHEVAGEAAHFPLRQPGAHERALVTVATALGALVLARAVDDPKLSNALREAALNHLTPTG